MTWQAISRPWRELMKPPLSQALCRIWHMIGRRGAFLAFLTVLDVCYGVALLTTMVRALKYVHPDLFLPLSAWGWIWIGVGCFVFTGLLADRDIIQFTAAALLKGVWAVLYADLWLVQHQDSAWISAVVWLSFSLTVLVIAGWPEPEPARKLLEAATNGHDVSVTTETTVTTDTTITNILRDEPDTSQENP
jgi:hypothetical protein